MLWRGWHSASCSFILFLPIEMTMTHVVVIFFFCSSTTKGTMALSSLSSYGLLSWKRWWQCTLSLFSSSTLVLQKGWGWHYCRPLLMVFYYEENDNDAHYHYFLILLFYYEEDDDGTIVVVFLWFSIVKKMTSMCAIIIIIFFFYSFFYHHFAGVKKIMSPTCHPLMLFCKGEKMTTNNYVIHCRSSVVLQEWKNDNEQRNLSLFWCGLTSMNKRWRTIALFIIIVVWFCKTKKMTMSSAIAHRCFCVVLQAWKNAIVCCHCGVASHERKNNNEQCNYSLSFWCERASSKN